MGRKRKNTPDEFDVADVEVIGAIILMHTPGKLWTEGAPGIHIHEDKLKALSRQQLAGLSRALNNLGWKILDEEQDRARSSSS